jgi:hypothetical protein
MKPNLSRSLALVIVLGILLTALSGCWNPFAPDKGKDPPPRPPASYRDRLHPDDVIHNLQTSYEYMNAQEYLYCLAEEFIFHTSPADQNDPENPLEEQWFKQDERDIHNAMFADGSNVERIRLTLTVVSSGFNEGGDPGSTLDDTWDYRVAVDLQVVVPPPDGGENLILLANADQDYVFSVDPNETGPNGEDLWEVLEWWDLEDGSYRLPAGDSCDIRSTFGRIKARFIE